MPYRAHVDGKEPVVTKIQFQIGVFLYIAIFYPIRDSVPGDIQLRHVHIINIIDGRNFVMCQVECDQSREGVKRSWVDLFDLIMG